MITTLGLAAIHFVGVPYKWGGFDYTGLDCSALVVKSFESAGWPIKNMTSQEIHSWAKGNLFQSCKPREDCLLFYSSTRERSNISHVAIGLSRELMIESGGAGRSSLNMTGEELLKRDARVRIMPIAHRENQLVSSFKIDWEKLRRKK